MSLITSTNNTCVVDTFSTLISVNFSTGLDNISNPKQIIEIFDVFGRKIKERNNIPLVYIYDDGTYERKFTIE